MSKQLLFAFCLVVLATSIVCDRFANVNFEEVFENRRLLRSYVNCFVDKGRCTSQAKEYKKLLPDVMAGCNDCTQTERKRSHKFLIFAIENRDAEFAEIEKVYDPDRKFRKRYCRVAKEDGIATKKCL